MVRLLEGLPWTPARRGHVGIPGHLKPKVYVDVLDLNVAGVYVDVSGLCPVPEAILKSVDHAVTRCHVDVLGFICC